MLQVAVYQRVRFRHQPLPALFSLCKDIAPLRATGKAEGSQSYIYRRNKTGKCNSMMVEIYISHEKEQLLQNPWNYCLLLRLHIDVAESARSIITGSTAFINAYRVLIIFFCLTISVRDKLWRLYGVWTTGSSVISLKTACSKSKHYIIQNIPTSMAAQTHKHLTFLLLFTGSK